MFFKRFRNFVFVHLGIENQFTHLTIAVVCKDFTEDKVGLWSSKDKRVFLNQKVITHAHYFARLSTFIRS